MMVQAPVVPTDSLTSGAIFVLIDAIVRTWPICSLIVVAIWKISRATRSMETFTTEMQKNVERIDKRLDGHSETLDKHETRISKTEAATGILLNHTGLTAP